MILDKHITKVISNNVNMTVPYYLMASYAYYEKDDPILSDDFYDKLAKKILKQWDNIEHYHKYLLSKDMLEAGSYIGKYPSIVLEALDNLRKTVKK
jgi:hypothetical protein